MELSTLQRQYLQSDLLHSAKIEYDEVFDELFDHYLTLVENSMESGELFEVARKNSWESLGGIKGVRAVEKSFVKSVRRQIRARHLGILKSYFRWPTLVTTVLVGVLSYLVVPLVSDKNIMLGFILVSVFPAGFVYWKFYRPNNKRRNHTQIGWEYCKHMSSLPWHLLQICLLFPTGFGRDGRVLTKKFLVTQASVATMLLFVLLVFTASCIQLSRSSINNKPILS